MYLNLYQKYILELLSEFDGLLVRQLAFMVRRFKEPHLQNIDGYLEQLRIFNRIEIVPYKGEDAVILPGGSINENMVTAFDIMFKFSEYLVDFAMVYYPAILRFYINPDKNHDQEINIIPVETGKEDTAVNYAKMYITDIEKNAGKISYPPSFIFVIQDKRQMTLIKLNTDYSFVIMENDGLVFYGK